MATTFQNDTLFEGNNEITVHFQAYGDADQTTVKVLDLGTTTFPSNRPAGATGVAGTHMFRLLEASWSIQGWEYVQLLWDATTDDEIITMSGDGSVNLRGVGGKRDPQSSGTVGDVLITSQGAGTDSSYNIVVTFGKQ